MRSIERNEILGDEGPLLVGELSGGHAASPPFDGLSGTSSHIGIAPADPSTGGPALVGEVHPVKFVEATAAEISCIQDRGLLVSDRSPASEDVGVVLTIFVSELSRWRFYRYPSCD